MGAPNRWTKEACTLEAAKHMSRKAFSMSSAGAYQAAMRYGWMNEICGHMIYRPRKVHVARVRARDEAGHVYFLLRPDGLLKIGFTIDLWPRIREHGYGCEVIGAVPGTPHDEHRIHAEFAAYRLPRAGSHGHAPELFIVPPEKVAALRDAMLDKGFVPERPANPRRRTTEHVKREGAVRPVTYTFTCEQGLPEKIANMSVATGLPAGHIVSRALDLYFAQSITRTEAA